MAEQDQVILNTFARQERESIDRWLAEEEQQPKPTAKPQEAPAAEPAAPAKGAVQRAAEAIVPTVPGTGNLVQRYVTGPIGQRVAEGVSGAVEARGPYGAPSGKSLLSLIGAILPFTAPAGEVSADAGERQAADWMKDDNLKAALKQAEDELARYGPEGNPEFKERILRRFGEAQPDVLSQVGPGSRVEQLKNLLTMPYSSRMGMVREESRFLGELGAGVATAGVPGYTKAGQILGKGYRAIVGGERAAKAAVAPAAAPAAPAAERPLRALPPASIPGGPSPQEVVEAAETARVQGTPEFQAWQAREGLAAQRALPAGPAGPQPALPGRPAQPALAGRVGAQLELPSQVEGVRPMGPSSLEPRPMPPSSPQEAVEQAGADYRGTTVSPDGTTLHQYRDPETGSFDVVNDQELANLPAKLADDRASLQEAGPIAAEIQAPRGEKDVEGIKQRMFVSPEAQAAYFQLQQNEELLRQAAREKAGVARFFRPPKPKAVTLSDEQTAEIIEASKAGGVSYNPSTGAKQEPKAGFAVSVAPDRVVITPELTPEIVKKFAADNSDLLADPRANLGSWRADDGYHLDVSIVAADKAEALRLGRQYKQRAVFDFSTMQDVDIPKTALHKYEKATADLDDADVRAAQEYDAAQTNLALKPVWDDLMVETDRIYEDLVAKGLKVEVVDGQPYLGLKEMLADLHQNRLKVSTEGAADHPFWTPEQNIRFRVVHDATAHTGGSGFDLDGEYRAFLRQADAMGLPDGDMRAALQTEVYGQAAAYYAHGGFQEQKAFLPSAETRIILPPPLERLALGLPAEQADAVTRAIDRLKATWEKFWTEASGDRGAVGRVTREGLLEKLRKNGVLYNDITSIGAAYLWKGAGSNSFNNWSRAMLDEFGGQFADRLRPILGDLYEASKEKVAKFAEQATGKPDSAPKLINLKRVLDLAEDGQFGAGWYDTALDEVRARLGADKADLYLDLVAAFSPRQSVDTNILKANEAFNMAVTGVRSAERPFASPDDGLKAHIDNANRALRGEPLSGPKVGPFSAALKGDRSAVVVDSWMGRMFGFGEDISDNENAIVFIQQIVTDAAKQLQMDPRQVQAAMWSAFKLEAEAIARVADPKHAGVIGDVRSFSEIFKSRADELPSLDEILAAGRKSVDETGAQLPGWVTEEGGRVRLGTLLLMTRATAGAMLAASQGESPEEAAMLALLGAGAGTLLSPRLAGHIAEVVTSKEGQQIIKHAFKSESGAIDPASGIGNFFKRREPSPNVDRMGASEGAKRLVLDINGKLEKARKLARAGVVTHSDTIAAALQSKYRNLDEVLGMDRAKLTLDELPAARTAARGVRDFVMEDTIEAVAKAKLNPDDASLAATARQKYSLAGQVSKQVTDFETWVARAQEAGKIESEAATASKWNLDEFSKQVNDADASLTGTVSDAEFVKRVSEKIEKLPKLAAATANYPQAFWNIYYGLSMLSSPLTHVKNILGDTIGLGMAVADRAVAEGVELVMSPFTAAGMRKQNVAYGETFDLVAGTIDMIMDSFRAGRTGAKQVAGQTLRTGESVFGSATKGAERLKQLQDVQEANVLPRIIDVMNTAAQANLRFMDATDEFFKVLSFNGEVRALARRKAMGEGLTGRGYTDRVAELVANPDKEILAAAQAFAHENTFTKAFDPNGTGWRHLWGGGALAEKASKHPIMRLMLTPFFRTPTRLAEFSTVHTPLLNAMAVQTWSDIAAGGAKAELAVSKMVTGIGVVSVAGWMAVNNLLTGEAPKNAELRAAYERAGWKEYSVYVPIIGKYISYKGIEPLSTMLGTVANFAQMVPHLEDHQIQTLAMALVLAAAPSALANPYAQGIADVGDVITAAEKGYDLEAALLFAARRAASWIPGAALGRAVSRVTDPNVRETKLVAEAPPEARELSRYVAEVMRTIPGWSSTRPAKVNMITGEPIANEYGWLGLINPFQITTNKNDKVLNELVSLGGAGLPREFPRVIGGRKPSASVMAKSNNPDEGVWLTDNERTEMQRTMTREVKDVFGRTLHAAMEHLMGTPIYKDAQDQDKALMMRQEWGAFYKDAEQRFLDKHPDVAGVVGRRQLERELGRLPSSMENLKDPMRQSLDQILGGQR